LAKIAKACERLRAIANDCVISRGIANDDRSLLRSFASYMEVSSTFIVLRGTGPIGTMTRSYSFPCSIPSSCGRRYLLQSGLFNRLLHFCVFHFFGWSSDRSLRCSSQVTCVVAGSKRGPCVGHLTAVARKHVERQLELYARLVEPSLRWSTDLTNAILAGFNIFGLSTRSPVNRRRISRGLVVRTFSPCSCRARLTQFIQV
jgi:hypothetical protein